MSTHTTQLAARARTWLLIAGLTGLVIALGAVIGGPFLWVFAGAAVIFNLVGYLYSDRIALRVARAEALQERDAPAVFSVVRELSARADIPAPRLYVMPGEQPNAFATGRNPQHAAVAMTEGLLFDLSIEQVRGVLAHELAHVKNRDILVSSIAAMIAGAISAVANVLALSFLFGAQDEDNPLGLLDSLAAMILAPLGAALLQLGISRQREYLADATAARLMGRGAPLADALEAIEGTRAPALDIAPLTAPMYIANPLGRGHARSLFCTHPPLAERVRRLRAYDREAARRPASAPAANRLIVFDAR